MHSLPARPSKLSPEILPRSLSTMAVRQSGKKRSNRSSRRRSSGDSSSQGYQSHTQASPIVPPIHDLSLPYSSASLVDRIDVSSDSSPTEASRARRGNSDPSMSPELPSTDSTSSSQHLLDTLIDRVNEDQPALKKLVENLLERNYALEFILESLAAPVPPDQIVRATSHFSQDCSYPVIPAQDTATAVVDASSTFPTSNPSSPGDHQARVSAQQALSDALLERDVLRNALTKSKGDFSELLDRIEVLKAEKKAILDTSTRMESIFPALLAAHLQVKAVATAAMRRHFAAKKGRSKAV